jgi:hydroxymethylbilane synthase
MSDRAVRLGTRGSRLAIAQAEIAARALDGVVAIGETVTIKTPGDAVSERHPRAGWDSGDGQFTRSLEAALLDGRVDLVVHSYKDLPTTPADGLLIAAVLPRADAADCLMTRDGDRVADLPHGAAIGTSSPRRAAQLVAVRDDLRPAPIRGNVETRLRRLASGEYDGLLLAVAGLDRLGIGVPEPARLSFELMLPAPAQGALAIQARAGDASLLSRLTGIDHAPTRIAVEAERALLRRLGGGCLAPLGAYGQVAGDTLRLRAALGDGGGPVVRADATGPARDALGVVEAVASQLTSATAPA